MELAWLQLDVLTLFLKGMELFLFLYFCSLYFWLQRNVLNLFFKPEDKWLTGT